MQNKRDIEGPTKITELGDRTMNQPKELHEAVLKESGGSDQTVERGAKVEMMPGTMHGSKNLSAVDPFQVEGDTFAGWIDGTAIQKTTDITGDKASQEHAGFAWSLYHHTLELFSLLLLPTLAHVVTFTPPNDKQGEKSFKKSLGRFYLWGGGFSGGKLESVLDESESLREIVVESLAAIGKILLFELAPKHSAHSIAPEDPRIKQEIRDLGVLVEKARIITESDYESDESSASTNAAQDASFGIITSGKTLTISQATRSTSKISGPAQPYVLKVYDKFPLADMHLMHRLGEANWQRHMSLRAMGNEEEVEQLPQELPKITFVAVFEFQDSGLGSSLPARSTFAATVASHSSFQTTADEKDSWSLRVPPTPEQVSNGEPFNCQICGHFLSNIRNRVDWRRHVFADLKPYLCTFPGCKDEFKTFATRKLWEEHEFGQHRMNNHWACSTCQHKSKSPELWRAHLVQAHTFPLSDGQYVLDARLVEVHEPIPIESLSCPLCLEIPGKSQRHFATHVGKHMEIIALAALPRDKESTDTESIASNVSDTSNSRISDYPSSQDTKSRTLEELRHEEIDGKRTSQKASLISGVTSRVHSDLASDAQWRFQDQGASSITMSRTARGGNIPFIQNGPISPPLNSISYREDWGSQEQPLTSHASSQGSGLEEVPEVHFVEESPHDFIMRTMSNDFSPVSSSALNDIDTSSSRYFNLQMPSTPITNSLTTATTFTCDMSRQNSLCNGPESTINSDQPFSIEQNNDQPLFGSDAHSRSLHQVVTEPTSEDLAKPDDPIRVTLDGKPHAKDLKFEPFSSKVDDKSADRRLPRRLGEEAEEDEAAIPRSLARRKRSTSAAELPPQKCKEPGCDKEFKRPSYLTKHEKQHSRPWKCPVESCKYHAFGWPTEEELNRHNNEKHSSDAPVFECHYKPCPYQSKRESNCKQHMERAHGWEFVRPKSTTKRRSKTDIEISSIDTYIPVYSNNDHYLRRSSDKEQSQLLGTGVGH
ncbi:hypothetical protein BKA65DRAFT_593972 [Rhexocercosporidium sp. MPI-PUGE-AT-0058]|nr:hypothetical protein BKA65DRAFT_593972 [Rhexocercosporidium sp. MPI-PUGE-AT-0058]